MSLRMMGQATVTMNQLQQKMDMIGHNLANSQTVGYKSRQAEFSSLLFQQINNLSDPENARNRVTSDGIRVGTGARLGAINSNLSIGSIQTTERDLDAVLLDEKHYFQIEVEEIGEQQIRYTRDGSFYLQPVGDEVVLVTKDGHPVLGVDGPIQFANNFDSIQIGDDGSINVKRGNETDIVGTLAVAEVIRPRVLETTGDNLFRLPDLAALGYEFAEIIQAPAANTRLIHSGALEMSNVDLGEQMTQLINAQRSYQFNARTITMADQMQGLINQVR